MIDVAFRGNDARKATVYLDGPDARLFRRLREELDSETAVQNAFILEGLLQKVKAEHQDREIRKIRNSFPKLVGVSYEDFSKMVSQTS